MNGCPEASRHLDTGCPKVDLLLLSYIFITFSIVPCILVFLDHAYAMDKNLFKHYDMN